MQTALRSLTFSSTSDDPTLEGTRTGRTVGIQIDDGKGSNNLSNTITSSFSIAAVNDRPVVTAGTGATPTHAPGLGAVVVDSGLTLADVDNANLTGATVTLTSRPDGTAEALALTGAARTAAETAGITVGSYDGTTGTLTPVRHRHQGGVSGGAAGRYLRQFAGHPVQRDAVDHLHRARSQRRHRDTGRIKRQPLDRLQHDAQHVGQYRHDRGGRGEHADHHQRHAGGDRCRADPVGPDLHRHHPDP